MRENGEISTIRHDLLWIGCELRSDTRERVGRARHGRRCRHSQSEMKQTRNVILVSIS